MTELLSIKQASDWATEYLNKNVTTSNISYLINYGRIKNIGDNGAALIDKFELIKYYTSYEFRKSFSNEFWNKNDGNCWNLITSIFYSRNM